MEDEALTDYIHGNYGHLFTCAETLAAMTIRAEMKAQNAEGTKARLLRRHFGSSDPQALRLLADGVRAFRARVRDRILAEHKDEVVLNRCPKCGSLARTPKACLCPVCHHTWYELRGK